MIDTDFLSVNQFNHENLRSIAFFDWVKYRGNRKGLPLQIMYLAKLSFGSPKMEGYITMMEQPRERDYPTNLTSNSAQHCLTESLAPGEIKIPLTCLFLF